jgi:hypothetical protein
MSTVTGTILNHSGGRASRVPIVFVYLSNPAVTSNAGVFFENKTIFTDENGQFSTVLPMGRMTMTVGALAVYTLVVPDNTTTYDFIDLLDPEVTVTQSVANPIAVLGLWIKQNAAELRTVPNMSSNRFAILYLSGNPIYTFYRWLATSEATDTGTTVVKPNDTESDEPGRWIWFDHGLGITAGATFFDVEEDVTALTAIPSDPANRMRAIKSGPHPFWYYVHGDSAGNADGTNVLRADDDGGNWYQLPLTGV